MQLTGSPAPALATTEWLDLSDVQALGADVLVAMHREAQRRVQASAHNRAGLAYHDAKMARDVLAGEQRRRAHEARAAVTVARTITPDEHGEHGPCGIACASAMGTVCRCECGGAQHGALRRQPITVPGPRRDPFANLPLIDDEPF